MKVGIIGGGASGMMSAVMIARRGHEVTLFEKNEKLGKKIYITGKGRCNVTNTLVGNEFLSQVVNGKKFMIGAITRFNSADTVAFFEDLGVKLKVERGGRVFPESDKSSDIIKAFERALKWAGVKVLLNQTVKEIKTQNSAVVALKTMEKTYDFDAVIVATGGVSYPSTGSTGDGYTFAKNVGHNIVDPVPALVSINLNSSECKALEGLTLKNVKLFAKTNDDKIIYETGIGELVYTENGISGPLALTLSSFINRCDLKNIKIYIDLKPALSLEVLTERINREISLSGTKQVGSLLRLLMPNNMVQFFAKRAQLKLGDKANQLTKEKRKNISFLLKNYDYFVVSLENFDRAVITSGGVSLKQINPKNMMSKIISGLYFVGEVLDIDALTGGFNLQIAFSTAVTCASDFKNLKE